jgi:hypothetical protein
MVRAGAGAGAVAGIFDKLELEPEPHKNWPGSATLPFTTAFTIYKCSCFTL